MSSYHVVVVGAGSVGLCLAAHFAQAGARVSLLARKASIDSLRNNPLRVSGLLGDHDIPQGTISVQDAAAPGEEAGQADMLVLTTKAYDVKTALQPFAAMDRCPPVLMLQNGMGSAEIARGLLTPNVPLYSSAMMIGMVRQAPTLVSVTAHSSPILCGSLLGSDQGLGDDVTPLRQMLEVSKRGFIPMAHDSSIRETIAFKLLFNSFMNPTGAITGQTYGELIEDPNSRALIMGLAEETLAAFAMAFDYRPAENGRHYVDETLRSIIFPRSTGHRSSMLQDLQAGRRTEIDFLNGAVIRLAKTHGLSATRHQSILQLIKARESICSRR
ncbi:MAG: 2-dehydropantoate 2-reductase [Pseudomonadota bacterium]